MVWAGDVTVPHVIIRGENGPLAISLRGQSTLEGYKEHTRFANFRVKSSGVPPL